MCGKTVTQELLWTLIIEIKEKTLKTDNDTPCVIGTVRHMCFDEIPAHHLRQIHTFGPRTKNSLVNYIVLGVSLHLK